MSRLINQQRRFPRVLKYGLETCRSHVSGALENHHEDEMDVYISAYRQMKNRFSLRRIETSLVSYQVVSTCNLAQQHVKLAECSIKVYVVRRVCVLRGVRRSLFCYYVLDDLRKRSTMIFSRASRGG